MADGTGILYNEPKMREWCRKHDNEGIYSDGLAWPQVVETFGEMNGPEAYGYSAEEHRAAVEWAIQRTYR